MKTPVADNSCHCIVVEDGIDLENMVSDTTATVSEAASAGPDLNFNPTLEIHPLQPIYNPGNYTERSWMIARAEHRSPEVSEQTAAAQTMLEPETSLHHDDHHIGEDMDIAAGSARGDIAVESAVGRDIRGPTTQTPEDAIGPSLDA